MRSRELLFWKVSKLFRAYGLYNEYEVGDAIIMDGLVSKLFRAYGLYNTIVYAELDLRYLVSKLFRAYGLYNCT